MRLMGLDIGERRIGIAFASFLDHPGLGAVAASEVQLRIWGLAPPMVMPAGFLLIENKAKAAKDLADMAHEEEVAGVVIGVPLRGGQESRQSQKIREFAALFRAELDERIPIFFWDESLTSFGASHLLRDAELKHSGQKAKGRVDSVAATLILKSFFEHWQGKMP